MTQFLDIFGFLSVLLRGFTLAFEALTVGGVIFALVVARPILNGSVPPTLLKWLTGFAALLALTQITYVAADSAILVGTTDLGWSGTVGAGFWTAGTLTAAGALGVAFAARTWLMPVVCPIACTLILAGSLLGSHSVARLNHREIVTTCTLLHHLAAAGWIGALPYLLLTLRQTDQSHSVELVSRFSNLAVCAVLGLASAGFVLTYFYVGSLSAAGETTYGIMLVAKIILTAMLLVFGTLNFRIVNSARRGRAADFLPLRRFGEAEIGIGFTVLLAAASLTSAPPASDIISGRVSAKEIGIRMRPEWPTMQTPPFNQLSPATPLGPRDSSALAASLNPGPSSPKNPSADIAWSEYNHHWAGVVVFVIGVLALLSRRFVWAKHWPLTFLGLALFLLIRADAENWPLGPRGFWESFQVAEVAQHRLFILLIVAFAAFEWAVQKGLLAPERAGLVFPLVCATGGALLLTHSHSLSNGKEEFLAELSHIPLAVLAALAGWSRWLEIRCPVNRIRVFSWTWPACFVLVGSILLLYREH